MHGSDVEEVSVSKVSRREDEVPRRASDERHLRLSEGGDFCLTTAPLSGTGELACRRLAPPFGSVTPSLPYPIRQRRST